MGQDFYNKFKKCMSPSRSYDYTLTPTQTNHEITSSYQYNVMLCESLYPSLNLMEVSLRNSIHDYFKVHYVDDRWFEDATIIGTEEIKKVVEAKATIAKRNKVETTDRVVAELSLGFWVALFKKNYENKFWHTPDAFTQIFPRISRPERNRKDVFGKLLTVKDLRNSVFHHDNLLKDPNLSLKYQAIYRVLHWIEPELAKFSKNFDRFQSVTVSGLAQASSCQMNVFYDPACIAIPNK